MTLTFLTIFHQLISQDLVLNIVGDTNGDIRSVIYSDMPIEGEHCVFDLFDDVPFECQNNSAEEEDGERREYEEDGGVISDSRRDQDSDNHDDECPKKTQKVIPMKIIIEQYSKQFV